MELKLVEYYTRTICIFRRKNTKYITLSTTTIAYFYNIILLCRISSIARLCNEVASLFALSCGEGYFFFSQMTKKKKKTAPYPRHESIVLKYMCSTCRTCA